MRAKDLCSRDDKKANKGKPHGRRNVALEDLPVERIVIDPPERSAPGGERFVQIGEEVSEHVEHRAASLVRVQWVRRIFVDPGEPTSAANDDASVSPVTASNASSPVPAGADPAMAAEAPAVVGRRNWVFCGSDHGAVANTIAVSLIASCEMHGIEPWAYLRDVLMLLPSWSQLRVLELSPKHWRATAARPDVRERLAKLHALFACTPPAHATTPAAA